MYFFFVVVKSQYPFIGEGGGLPIGPHQTLMRPFDELDNIGARHSTSAIFAPMAQSKSGVIALFRGVWLLTCILSVDV